MEREIGISQNTLKNLYDKYNENIFFYANVWRSSDKRKLATKEIEKYVRNLVETKNEDQIKTLIDYFEKEYINSREQPQKKAGLISFAAIALGLTRDVNNIFCSHLNKPFLGSFGHSVCWCFIASCFEWYERCWCQDQTSSLWNNV